MATHQLADQAQSGFSEAAKYDQHRPSYPPESVEGLLSGLGVAGVIGRQVVDLAAGTGKLTELIAMRAEAYEVLAVEPHADMRGVLKAKSLPQTTVVEGFAEDMSKVEDCWADAVVVAQAFHWFCTADALKEIHRVLKPGGTLGLIWNVEDYNARKSDVPSTEWESKLKEITWALPDEGQRFRYEKWQQIFDDQLKSSPLSIHGADPLFSLPLGEHTTKWEVKLTKEGVWDRFRTISQIANLKGKELEDCRNASFKAMDSAETDENGLIVCHGNTFAFWTTAIPSAPLK